MSNPLPANRLVRKLRSLGRRTGKSNRPKTCYRPQIDPLEKRNLLTTFTVFNDADSGIGSLRQAVMDANDSPGRDSIAFDLSAETITLTSGQLVISDDLTIKGPGAEDLTILGAGDRVFAIVPQAFADDPDGLFSPPSAEQLTDAPRVRIEKLSIENGVAINAIGYDLAAGYAFGGGIYNMGGSVHLDRAYLSNNQAVGGLSAGGAIANEFGGELTIERSRFENNTSSGVVAAVGGAITSDSGATVEEDAQAGTTTPPVVDVSRSVFVGNTAETQTGYVDEPQAAFSGVAGGGAILNVTGALTVSQSHFEANSVFGGNAVADVPGLADSTTAGIGVGGAILSGNLSPFGFAQSTLMISRSTFEDNAANGGSGEAAGVAGGLAAGGAVAVGNGSDATLERNHFDTNLSAGGAGNVGGIGTGGAVSASDTARLGLQRNHFAKNTAKGGSGEDSDAAGRGGALGVDTIPLYGFGKTTFPDGSMPFAGPAIGSSERDLFEGNQAIGGIGGGIYNEGELSINRSTLSGNEAIGQADVSIDFVPGYSFVGAALGGGISNLGTLDIDKSKIDGNRSIGADGAIGLFFGAAGAANYPGLAVGGGLHNIQVATVTNTSLRKNDAIGGDSNVGSFAGVANGGGVYNDGFLELDHGSLRDNVAIGGDNNVGDINVGGGYGGGITSGSVTFLNFLAGEAGRDASLAMNGTSVRGNQAIGGANNSAVAEVPTAHLPAGATGGGILVFQGTADISKSMIANNHARGGEGGIGAGGGVFFFGFVGTVDAKLSSSMVVHNTATGGDGADGLGGGIATGSLGSLVSLGNLGMNPEFTNVTVNVSRTLVVGNKVEGGVGGDGHGGGIYNGEDAEMSLERSMVFRNQARGGLGGQGIGGGVFNLGDFDTVRSRIFANWASDADDNCSGC